MSFILLKEKCDKLGTDERCPVRRFPGWALLWGDFKRCHSQCGSGNCAMSVQWWRLQSVFLQRTVLCTGLRKVYCCVTKRAKY